ncbi:MAG: DUF5060 domain-containing protein, partial [Anaerolineae bacterium]|nr:DUF5060 domain-containing protein [Anaerolineae bacterium]
MNKILRNGAAIAALIFVLVAAGIATSRGGSAIRVAGISAAPSYDSYVATQYEPFEISLVAAESYTNAYTDQAVVATFTLGGTSMDIMGFWDGGDDWIVRWTPTEAGVWSYSISPDSTDAGLTESGTVTVSAAGAGDHGFLRVNPDLPYTFEYDDGTPWFSWGNTYYELASMGLIDDQWQDAIDGSAAAGFTKIRTLVYPWPSFVGSTYAQPFPVTPPFTDRPNDVLDISYWQKLDEVVEYIADAGMVTDLVLYGADELTAYGTDEQNQRFVEYVMARYGGYPSVIFDMTNEWQYSPYPKE